MDQLIVFLKLAGALASLAAGIIRILSTASEFGNRDEDDR